MSSSTANNIRDDDSSSNASGSSTLLQEANELAKSKDWTRDFALYIMFCRAMAEGDKIKAESCMKLLEQDFRNSVRDYDGEDDPNFLKDKRSRNK
jgi:hypothetical protein